MLKIAAFQFKGSGNIEQNFNAIARGIQKASEENVRCLLTQECALCGYPPLERDSVASIDFEKMKYASGKISDLAREYEMFIGLGTILKEENNCFNAVEMISPDGEKHQPYIKRALWGWDQDNYSSVESRGIYIIDEIPVGVRICFEVRFPEYFRELFKEKIKIAFVSFCDVSATENAERYEIIKAHLITRAVENTMYVVSANSISNFQTAPTCIIDPDGKIVKICSRDNEELIVFPFEGIEDNFGRAGRIRGSEKILG